MDTSSAEHAGKGRDLCFFSVNVPASFSVFEHLCINSPVCILASFSGS